MAKRPEKPPILPQEEDVKHITLSGREERAIGRVIVAWSKLEAGLEHLIWTILDLPIEYGRIITTKLDANGRIQMLRNLASLEYTGDKLESVKETLGQIDIIRDDRNFVAHGNWTRAVIVKNGLPEHTPMALSVKVKHDPLLIVGESFPAKRMSTLERTIYSLLAKIIELQREAE